MTPAHRIEAVLAEAGSCCSIIFRSEPARQVLLRFGPLLRFTARRRRFVTECNFRRAAFPSLSVMDIDQLTFCPGFITASCLSFTNSSRSFHGTSR